MSWFSAAILACLSWGIGQTFIKRGLSSVSPFITNSFFVLFSLLIMIPFALLNGGNYQVFSLILFFGLLSSLPNLVLPYALEKGNVSLSGTLVATYPIITVLLSVIFLHEQLPILGWVGVVLAIFGSFLIGKPRKFSLKLESWLLWGLFGCVIIGFGDFIGKLGVMRYDLYSFLFVYAIGNAMSLLITGLIDKAPKVIRKFDRGVIIGIAGTLLMQTGMLFFYIAMNTGQASQVSPIASVYPVITTIFAYYYLKEKITSQQLAGIILATLGVIFISL